MESKSSYLRRRPTQLSHSAWRSDQVIHTTPYPSQCETLRLFLGVLMFLHATHHTRRSNSTNDPVDTTIKTRALQRVMTSHEPDSALDQACTPNSTWLRSRRRRSAQTQAFFDMLSRTIMTRVVRTVVHASSSTISWSESTGVWGKTGHLHNTMSLRTCCTPNDLTERHNVLHIWGLKLLAQSDDIEGIEKAISAFKTALAIAPDLWSAKSHCLSHVAYAVGLHFDRSGRVSALNEFIQLFDATRGSFDIPHTAFLASHVARIMLLRAQVAEMTMARQLVIHATKLCRARQHQIRTSHGLSSHTESAALDLQIMTGVRIRLQLGERSSELDMDAEVVLQLCQQHLAHVKSSHPSTQTLTGLVLTCALALIAKARSTRDSSYLVEADYLVQQELDLERHGDSSGRADLLAVQADIMLARSELLGWNETYLMKAWELYQGAAAAPAGRTIARFQTCLRWASHAVARGYTDTAFDAYSLAIELLPHVVLLGDNVVGRIEALRLVSGLAVSSVETALTKGDIHAAVDFLEKTRGLIWFQLSHVRASEVSQLPVDLRDRFRDISQQMESPERHHWITKRHQVGIFGQTIMEIRTVLGFERFLMPPLLEEVVDALKQAEGYAVVIVPGQMHCDIMILGTSSGHSHLRLPSLNVERLCELSCDFRMECESVRATARRKFHLVTVERKHESSGMVDPTTTLLAELWSSLIFPILEHIGLTAVTDRAARPRLWWCPIGPLSSLPLHAAGVYQGSFQDHVGRYVVSSYTPTLTALHRLLVQNSIPVSPLVESQALLVAQPVTRGCTLLPAAQTEIELVQTLLSQESVSVTSHINGATIEAALEGAANAQIIHLACHGLQDQEDALRSGFELQDGRLTIAQLIRMNIPYGRLAYLSACESAGMDESRPDEGLNLVGTMIFVGFRSVIGTMWAMDDIDGPFMAERIYSRIVRGGVLDMSAVPCAVEDAVEELRELGVPASRWATYVHFGV